MHTQGPAMPPECLTCWPAYAPYMAALEALFERYARDGVLEMPNQTVVYRAPREGAGRNILI